MRRTKTFLFSFSCAHKSEQTPNMVQKVAAGENIATKHTCSTLMNEDLKIVYGDYIEMHC